MDQKKKRKEKRKKKKKERKKECYLQQTFIANVLFSIMKALHVS